MNAKSATRKGVEPLGVATPKLTPKQARFVDEYLVDLNATQAAIRAGYSKRSAEVIGYENLNKPVVAAAIEAKRKELASTLGITRERILKEMEKIAFSDPRAMFAPDGSLLPVHLMSDAAVGAIASFEVDSVQLGKPAADGTCTRTFTTKIKCWDKRAQLETLMKHLGMAEDKPAVPEDKSGDSIAVLREKLAKYVKRVAV